MKMDQCARFLLNLTESDTTVWTSSADLAYTCNPQITAYKSLLYVQGPGLARKFYLKQKNMKNAKVYNFSQ